MTKSAIRTISLSEALALEPIEPGGRYPVVTIVCGAGPWDGHYDVPILPISAQLQPNGELVCDDCDTVSHCMRSGCVPKVPQSQASTADVNNHGVTDDDGNLLLGQRSDGSPIWNDAEDPLPLHRVAHFTEDQARCKAWELAAAGYGPTGTAQLHHSGIARGGKS